MGTENELTEIAEKQSPAYNSSGGSLEIVREPTRHFRLGR